MDIFLSHGQRLLGAERKGLKVVYRAEQAGTGGKSGRNLLGRWEEPEEYLLQN